MHMDAHDVLIMIVVSIVIILIATVATKSGTRELRGRWSSFDGHDTESTLSDGWE